MNYSSHCNVSLVSWNTQSLSLFKKSLNSSFNSEKFLTLKKFNVSNLDVICLQEIHSSIKDLNRFAKFSLPNKKVIFSCDPENSYASLAIYFNEKFTLIEHSHIIPGRLLKIKLNMPNGQYLIIYNVYSFTNNVNESLNLLKLLQSDFISCANYPIYICGDFNIDISKTSHLSFMLNDLISSCNLINLSEKYDISSPTWRGDGNRASSFSTIDYILVNNVSLKNQRFLHLPVPTSDHSLLVLENVKIKNNIEAHKFAHIKEHLLQHGQFKEIFLPKLMSLLKKYFLFHDLENVTEQENFLKLNPAHISHSNLGFLDDPDFYESDTLIQIFDEIFLYMADDTHAFFKKIKSQKNKKFKRFKDSCIKVVNKNSTENVTNFVSAKSELRNHINHLQKLNIEKKRTDRLKNPSNRANDLFYFLGKGGGRHSVLRLRDPLTNMITDDPEEIVRIFSDHYESKTTDHANQQDEPSFSFPPILNDLLHQFNVDISDIFPSFEFQTSDDPFSIEEIKSILKDSKNKVATGPSRISKHSLLFLLQYIPNLFTAYINTLINKDDLSLDTRTSWILNREVIFIPKKSKDTLDVNNFRPISLLESIYKLISKLTILRFEKFIFKSISKSQFGFTKNKQMSLASQTVNQLIHALKSKNISSALISIDIKAAFDSAQHCTLNAIFEHLFPDNFLIQKIAKFSHNPTARVNINGVLGSVLKISKGVGQGDPASSYKYLILHHLFNFFIEKLMEVEQVAILKSDLSDALPNSPQENIAFADDTILFISENLSQSIADKFIRLYKKLKILTGLEVNPTKSNYLALSENPNPNFLSALSMLAQPQSSIEHLGVVIAFSPTLAKSETFEKVQKAMKSKMKILTERLGNVDIFTKILLMKSLIISKPLHCFRVYAPDEKMINDMWKVFKSALWTKSFKEKTIRRTKVASKRLCIPMEDGGLGIVHVKTSAPLSLLSSFLSILEHAVKDPSSILASILHENPE